MGRSAVARFAFCNGRRVFLRLRVRLMCVASRNRVCASMTFHRYRGSPSTFTTVSSVCHRSPTRTLSESIHFVASAE